MNTSDKYVQWWVLGSRVGLAGLALYFFVSPVWLIIQGLNDPGLRGDGIPRSAWKLHASLSGRYVDWVKERLAEDGGAKVHQYNISGTEWPVFGSLFYLQATEALQQAWEEKAVTKVAPAVYARDGIIAATDLLLDKGHASWVIKHWGEDRYMTQDNVFYRMLRIGGMTAYTNLLDDGKYLPQLREETESLVRSIDESPVGLLEDYPGECYPGDVMMAWLAIQNADKVLGTDHSAQIQRGLRGFVAPCVDSRGLSPYLALRNNGRPIGPARGCSNAYMGFTAPHLWPEAAKAWYDTVETHYWRERHGIVGFLEFPEDERKDWYMDVDAGPVIDGFSTSGSAFGVGAARANGRFDHAYPLAMEMLATSWALPGGTLVGPRVLSDATDAPLLGEACILFNLTRRAAPGVEIRTGGEIPPYVLGWVAFYALGGVLLAGASVRDMLRIRRGEALRVPLGRVQAILAASSAITSGICIAGGLPVIGLLLMLPALALPSLRREKAPKGAMALAVA